MTGRILYSKIKKSQQTGCAPKCHCFSHYSKFTRNKFAFVLNARAKYRYWERIDMRAKYRNIRNIDVDWTIKKGADYAQTNSPH
jgi:hypothetical protein